jgi:signal transduction histidine kinase
MASLGQLTAGIAHEINNPINFVKSNIKPLQLDINDLITVIDEYDELHELKNGEIDSRLKRIDGLKNEIDLEYVKKEIKNLIKGIEEGAERTAEIVRGLRTFSRLDESELKVANVHEGIESTLVLLKNSFSHHLKIIKDFKAEANIECLPGKLNQVFMNIINNSIQAIAAKKEPDETESITIKTRDLDSNTIEISIKDSGIGMTEEVKQKIYEPFFTTKEVGEGTGLGMSIAFKIIEKHHGKIKIVSSPGNGAEFILTLPYLQPVSKHF